MDENIKSKNSLNNALFKNIVIAICIMIYYIFINLGSINIDYNILLTDIKVFAIIILGISIIIFENAYKKDSIELAINGIEILFLAAHTLSITYIVNIFNFNFRYYILVSSYIFAIYYVFKDIIIYTRENRKYLKSLSDISDIVKKEKPSKKQATKKNVKQNIENENNTIVIEENKQEDKKEHSKDEKSKKEKTVKKNNYKKDNNKKESKKKENNKKENNEKENKKEEIVKEKKTTSKVSIKSKKTETTKKATKDVKSSNVKENKKEEINKETKLEENKPKRRGRPKKKVDK